MKSAIERVRELNDACQAYPAVLPIIGAILELQDKYRGLDEKKQDKLEFKKEDISPQDLTSNKLMQMIHMILTTAGEDRESIAIKIYTFLHSLV
jgi:hypothetical protein